MCLYLADYLLVFLTFPPVAARFAVYQSAGIVAYFGEKSLKGYRLFRKDGLGRQVGGLVHCGKECLACVELYLGTAEPEESMGKDMRTDWCSWCHRRACDQITSSRRGRWSLLWASCPRSPSAVRRPYSDENYVSVFSLLLRLLGQPDPRSGYFSEFTLGQVKSSNQMSANSVSRCHFLQIELEEFEVTRWVWS